jgi:hypothetical protein
MPSRVALSFCILLAVVALASPAHAAVVTPSSTSAETVVPAGGKRTLTLSCPEPAVALSAAASRLGRSAELLRSVPGRDAGDWRLTFAAGRGRGRTVEAELRCVRLRLPDGVSRARLGVQTRSQTRIPVPAGETRTAEADCDPGYVATGWGLRRGRRGDIRVAAAVPAAGGWSFELENIGSEAARAAVSARCVRRVVRARRGGDDVELRFRVVRRAFDDPVGGGRPSFVHRCRTGQFSLAAGSEVDPFDPIALVRSSATGRRRASWTFARASAGDVVTTHMVCLGRNSRFG